ncbi:Tn3 transposase DDE domain-containing protein [Streptomyces sp. 2323.1]|nr:Tn3 transposase DDE domain-containing protein [Streptomyces sp. 2323.1]
MPTRGARCGARGLVLYELQATVRCRRDSASVGQSRSDTSTRSHFSDWVRFGQRGTVAHNDPVEQEKDVKFTSLLASLVIFHNTLDIADAVRQLQAEGHVIDPLDLAQISPYLTEHINRFGAYSTHELGITPEDYDTRLDVDFSVLEDDQVPAAA